MAEERRILASKGVVCSFSDVSFEHMIGKAITFAGI